MSALMPLRTARIAAQCSLFVFLGHAMASACSYSSMPTEVAQTFSVRVVDQGKAVTGLQVELRADPTRPDDESRSVLTLTTDEDGLVSFAAVRPGPYFVGIKHAAFSPSVEVLIKKRPSKNAHRKITFDWPGVKPISVQSASGLLNGQIRTGRPLDDQAHPVFGPLGAAEVVLTRAVSGETIELVTASESGAFEFHPVPAGLYLLHIAMPANTNVSSEDGYVPIEISPSAKEVALNLFLFPGVCGSLGYRNGEEITTQ